MNYFSSPEALMSLLRILSEGMVTTVQIFALTLIFSLPLGLLITMGTMSRHKAIQFPIKLFILLMRGTPLMLQIFAVYFTVPGMLSHIGIQVSRMSACVLAFSINYAAYFAEIFRGGIQSIEQGQYEAGKVLGFTKGQVFFRIVLPQVIKRVLLPVSNEVITLVKDTALATSIAIVELFRVAKNQASSSVSMQPLFVAAIFYLVMNGIITQLFAMAEKRLSYYQS